MRLIRLSLLLPSLFLLPAAVGENDPAPEKAKEGEQKATPSPDQLYKQAVKMLDGKEVPQNPTGAVKLLIEAADKGHIPSMILVSSCCLEGIGTPKNPEVGLEIMHMAAKKDSAEAQRKLAMLYDNGVVGPRDPKSALYWFKKAADNNDALAIYFLGTYYSQGLEIEHNEGKALECFLKAAYMNEPHGQVAAAGCYIKGFGTSKDETEAFAWALVAADNGFPNMKDQLYPVMSQKALDKARPRAKEIQKKVKADTKSSSSK